MAHGRRDPMPSTPEKTVCTSPAVWATLPRVRPDAQTRPNGQAETRRQVNVQEAARLLNTTVEGVRSRIKRGSLDSIRVSGTVYVLLTPDQIEQPAQSGPDAQAQRGDQTSPDAQAAPVEALHQLVDDQRDQIEWLRREVERKDTLLMSLMQRIPELESPKQATSEKPRNGHETPAEDAGKGAVPPEPERAPWWRRWVGS